MFQVNTPRGERYMVQLVGPASYRMGNLVAYRGQSITVSKRTRDYLVRKTQGAWKDFDPTPPEDDFKPVLPPQFGEQGPELDFDDIDGEKNPALSMENAMALAAHGGAEVATNTPTGIDPDDLDQAPEGAPDAPDGSGDIKGADLAKAAAKGGQTATAAKPTGGVKLTTKATAKPATTGAVEVN